MPKDAAVRTVPAGQSPGDEDQLSLSSPLCDPHSPGSGAGGRGDPGVSMGAAVVVSAKLLSRGFEQQTPTGDTGAERDKT